MYSQVAEDALHQDTALVHWGLVPGSTEAVKCKAGKMVGKHCTPDLWKN